MIQRIWRGWTTPDNADSYEALLWAEMFAAIRNRNLHGPYSSQLLRREAGQEVEFVAIMSFDSPAAVSALAGEDGAAAFVPGKARELAAQFEQRSQEYEVRVAMSRDD